MKKQIKAFLLGAVSATLLSGLVVSSLAISGQMTITVDPINVQVNGEVFQPKDANGKDVPVFQYDGTTYAPLRALAEAYGLEVGYDAKANLATVVDPDVGNHVTTPTEDDTKLMKAMLYDGKQNGKEFDYEIPTTIALINGKSVDTDKPIIVKCLGGNYVDVNLLLNLCGMKELSNQYLIESISNADSTLAEYLIIDNTVYAKARYVDSCINHISVSYDYKQDKMDFLTDN